MDQDSLHSWAKGGEDVEDGMLPVELEPLKRKLRDIALRPIYKGEHSLPGAKLYHYTNEAGLRGILKSGMLWATCLPFLEDERETQYPKDFCYDYLTNPPEIEADGRRIFRTELTKTMRRSEDFVHCLEKQVASSLSTQTSLSSQWNAYADNGRGYALGFGAFDLLCVFLSRCKDANSTTEPNGVLRKMVYDPAEQRRILDDLLSAIFASPYFSDPRFEDSVKTLATYMFGLAAACFKYPSFFSEHEIRVNVANHLELALKGTSLPLECRLNGDRQIKYLQFDARHLDGLKMPLEEILIGPRLDEEAGRQVVEDILKGNKNVDGEAVLTRKVNPGELE